MNKTPLRILSISTDRTILDPNSASSLRQQKYATIAAYTDILILGTGSVKSEQHEALGIQARGGRNKAEAFFRAFFFALSQLSKKNYTVIYAQDVLYCGVLGYLLSFFSSARLVTQLHGDYLDNPLWLNAARGNRFLNSVGKFIVARSDRIRVVSIRIKEYVVMVLKKDPRLVSSIPIGIDEEAFNANGIPVTRNKQILFVGRLIPEKEPLFFCDIVIPVLKKHTEFSAVFIGEGELKEAIRARFAKEDLSDRCSFTGFLSAQAVAEHYKHSFVLIHTAFWEGWGMPMVEASACGLPVITTDTGCAGEVIMDGRNGIVIDSKDSTVYRAALENLIADPAHHRALCAEASALAASWTFERMKDRTRQFLEDALHLPNHD